MDLIRELGAMAFASRLKRLGDRLKNEASRVYKANGIDFSDSWFLVIVALSYQDRVTVANLAGMLGISHAAVSQMSSAMEREGFIASENDTNDRRRTLIYLTDSGRSTFEALSPLLDAIGRCTQDMIGSSGQDLLLGITRLEAQLDEQSLLDRVSQEMGQDQARREVRAVE